MLMKKEQGSQKEKMTEKLMIDGYFEWSFFNFSVWVLVMCVLMQVTGDGELDGVVLV
jgi:hypothetical protein